MKRSINVFKYNDLNIFFKDLYFFEQKNNPNLRLVDFAKKLGYKSHSSIQMFFTNNRPLTKKLVDTIVTQYQLNKAETVYLFKLLEKQNSTDSDQKRIENELQTIKPPAKRSNRLIVDSFDWATNKLMKICFVLIGIKGFRVENAHTILKGNFSKELIQTVIRKLQALGIAGSDLSPEALRKRFEEKKKLHSTERVVHEAERVKSELLEEIHSANKWYKEYLLSIHDECPLTDKRNIHRSYVIPLNDELLEDIDNFLKYKLDEFNLKFSARNGESYNLSVVDFMVTNISKIPENNERE